MGTKIAIAILSLCLTFSQLAPFAVLSTSLAMKTADYRAQASAQDTEDINFEIGSQDRFEGVPVIGEDGGTPPVEYDENGNPITPEETTPVENVHVNNYTLELSGYATFGVNTKDFQIESELSDDSHITMTYLGDRRSKVEVGYVTGIYNETDIYGYMANNIAGLNTLTNDKFEISLDDGSASGMTWICVPSQEPIDGLDASVFFMLSPDKDSAIWFRTDVYPATDNEDFMDIIETSLKSVNVYYIGGTVFNTPTEGFYEEATVDDNTAQNQDEFQENNEDHSVFHTDEGFVKSDLPENWDSFTMQLGQSVVSLPCRESAILDQGFVIDPSMSLEPTSEIQQDTLIEFKMFKDDLIISVQCKNNDRFNTKALQDCDVVDIVVDKADLKYISSMPEDFLILPGGLIQTVYKDDIIRVYGEPASAESMQVNGGFVRRLTYESGNKQLIIDVGMVSGISRVELKMT